MKKFVFKCETIRGGYTMVTLEGASENEARAKFNQPGTRFITDMSPGNKIVNVNNLVEVTLQEVINEPKTPNTPE